jgi:hypothetical protein
MEEAVEYITDRLLRHRIAADVRRAVDELAVTNRINEFMTHSAIYTTFLLKMGKSDPMYRALLNRTYLFDMEVEISDRRALLGEDELKDRILEIFDGRISYAYVRTTGSTHFVGIKLNEKAYSSVRNCNMTEDAIPHYLLVRGLEYDISSYKFNELIFGHEDRENEHGKYVELIMHIKQLSLPVSIIDHEMMHSNAAAQNVHLCYLHCGSSENWPESHEALNCAKTALYCFIYKKSKFRCDIKHEYVLLKYRGSYFRFQILLKDDRRSEYAINSKIAELISAQPPLFRKNVLTVKRFLDCHGYYPMHIDDRIIEIGCLVFGRGILSFGRFFNEFLEYRFDLEGRTLNLDSLKLAENQSRRFEVVHQHSFLIVTMPPKNIMRRLSHLKRLVRSAETPLFDGEMRIMTHRLLQPCLHDYDFVLSRDFVPGSHRITGSSRKQHQLGKAVLPEALPLHLRSKAYFFYSPTHGLLMVKIKEGPRGRELRDVLILKTSFRFILDTTGQ